MSPGFTSDCEFTCDAANRSRILYLFSRKTCVAETLPDSICFVNETASCIQGDSKFICDAVDRSHIPCLFQRNCASQESCRIPWVYFPCVFSSKMNPRFTSDCEFTCDAANCSHNSSKRMSHQKVGMSKVACHRMLVGGLDLVKRAKR